MDFITKTLKRPARIAALGLFSLFLAAPAVQAVERISVAQARNIANTNDTTGACGSRSPVTMDLSDEVKSTNFTATANDGYVFRYWKYYVVDPGPGPVNTSFDNPITFTYDAAINSLQLFPYFAPTYDVTLNPCNGDFSPDATNLVRVVYGDEYGPKLDVENNRVTRDGYNFAGWFTQSSGGSEVTASTIVSNATAHALYAHWNGITSTLTFNPNGGTFADPSEATRTVAYGSPYGPLPNVSMCGYLLDGWFKNIDDSSTRISESALVNETSDFSVRAKWSKIIYTVAFDGNGATSGSMNPMSNRVYDEPFTLSPNGFERSGSKFLGWNTKVDGTGDSFTNCANVVNLTTNNNDLVTLYAQWDAAAYRVCFQSGGGSGEMDVQTIPWDVDAALASSTCELTLRIM